MSVRSREMSPAELHAFVNALRACLGLGPLYEKYKDEPRDLVDRPDRYADLSHFGDGNRRVRSKG